MKTYKDILYILCNFEYKALKSKMIILYDLVVRTIRSLHIIRLNMLNKIYFSLLTFTRCPKCTESFKKLNNKYTLANIEVLLAKY